MHLFNLLQAQLEGKTLGILGYGREGKSTLRFLRGLFPNRSIVVADQNPELLEQIQSDLLEDNIMTCSGSYYLEELAAKKLDIIFKAPGIPMKKIDGLLDVSRISSQTELFLSVLRERTIGVTGTKGKSTTSCLLVEALQAAGRDVCLIGNIGKPVLDALFTDHPDRLYVFELSSHMLEQACDSPRFALLLNLYEEHLDHYRSFDAYIEAKCRIFASQQKGDLLVFGCQAARFLENRGMRIPPYWCISEVDIWGPNQFSFQSAVPPEPGKLTRVHLADGRMLQCPEIPDLRIPGRHNRSNALAALLIAWQVSGLSWEEFPVESVMLAMAKFTGLPHRLEYIADKNGVRYFNDSISTIPHATICAVEAVPNTRTLIIGGMDRGIDYRELVEFLLRGTVAHIILLPDTGHRIYSLLVDRVPESVSLHLAANMEEAVVTAALVTESGGACLLSPAAASYGFYTNFEARGDHFRELVAQLP